MTINLACDCVMPKLMVKVRRAGRAHKEPVYYVNKEIQASKSYSETITLNIPEVTARSEFELSVEVQDMDGEDLEEDDFEFYAMPAER